MKKSDIIENVKNLFNSQRLSVLSTQNKGQPYTSLVGFVSTEDLKSILFATTRDTRKFCNIMNDSRVAMLIDNRSNQITDFNEAIAVTATGKAVEIKEAADKDLIDIYLEKHPYLKKFVTSPTCALMKITVEKYYIVNRFQNVVELEIK